MEWTFECRHCLNADHLLLPDVQVPGVVLIVGDVHPVVVGDDPLVETQDSLVTSLQLQNTLLALAVSRLFQNITKPSVTGSVCLMKCALQLYILYEFSNSP